MTCRAAHLVHPLGGRGKRRKPDPFLGRLDLASPRTLSLPRRPARQVNRQANEKLIASKHVCVWVWENIRFPGVGAEELRSEPVAGAPGPVLGLGKARSSSLRRKTSCGIPQPETYWTVPESPVTRRSPEPITQSITTLF